MISIQKAGGSCVFLRGVFIALHAPSIIDITFSSLRFGHSGRGTEDEHLSSCQYLGVSLIEYLPTLYTCTHMDRRLTLLFKDAAPPFRAPKEAEQQANPLSITLGTLFPTIQD